MELPDHPGRCLLCTAILLTGGSAGAMPLVHDGDPEATSRASQQLGVPDLEPRPFADLRSEPPRLLSGGDVRPCAGEGVDLEGELAGLRSAYLYGEPDLAARLQALDAALACSDATPDQLGSYGMLAGVVHLEAGDEARATTLFAAAQRWHPAIVWDASFGPQLEERFRAAPPATASATLAVHPEGEVTVDGVKVASSAALGVGQHHVRVDGHGALVTVADADDTLVFPAAYPTDALGWMEDEGRRRDLAVLLSATLGEGIPAAVHVGGRTWTGTTGRVDWTPHGDTPAAPVQASNPSRPVSGLVVGGLVALGAGVATAATSYAMSGRWVDARTAGPRDLGAGLYYGGLGVAGAGGVALTAGLVGRGASR